jgi:citrate synthase
LEVAFLLIYGELPTVQQYKKFNKKVMTHTFHHAELGNMMKSFRYDAHPMGMFVSTMAALSTFHPEANPALAGQEVYKDSEMRNKQIYRILGTAPTIAASSYRHRIGREYNNPKYGGYTENFFYMLDNLNDSDYKPHPVLVRALDVLFILHAEHELNCSTSAVRHLASADTDVYTCIAGGASALYGPLHGGANEAVLKMLTKIGKKENIPAFIQSVKDKKEKLMGFGHRVYKNYDPRAKIVKKIAEEVFEVCGRENLIEIAMELESIALKDEYFISKKLYPNVDFYSGVIYKAMGFPPDFYPVMFAIPRIAGWLAHWNEFIEDDEKKIVRPRQVYLGERNREYEIKVERDEKVHVSLDSTKSSNGVRRKAAYRYWRNEH